MSLRLRRNVLEQRQSGRSIEQLPAYAIRPSLRFGRTAGRAFLACLGVGVGVAAVAAATRQANAWTEASARLLIVVPDPDAAAEAPAAAGVSRLAAVLQAAGVTAHAVAPAGIEALLGQPAEPDGPALITAARQSAPAIDADIAAVAPGSTVGPDGGEPASLLARFGTEIDTIARTSLALVALAAVASVVGGARTAVRAAMPVARLLHDLGASDTILAAMLARRTAVSTLAGAAAASGLALALLQITHTLTRAWTAPVLCLPLVAAALDFSCVLGLTRRRLRHAA